MKVNKLLNPSLYLLNRRLLSTQVNLKETPVINDGNYTKIYFELKKI